MSVALRKVLVELSLLGSSQGWERWWRRGTLGGIPLLILLTAVEYDVLALLVFHILRSILTGRGPLAFFRRAADLLVPCVVFLPQSEEHS